MNAVGSPRKMTAVFAGTRVEALQTLQRFAQVVSIVTVSGSQAHQYCRLNRLPVKLVDRKSKEDSFRFLAQQPVGLVLLAGFPFVLPGDVLRSGPVFVNSHPALLPAYKGYHAIRAAFRNGEEYMGVTVHYVVEEVDSGPPIHQERVCVKGMTLQEIHDLLFGTVEPMAIAKSLEIVLKQEVTR